MDRAPSTAARRSHPRSRLGAPALRAALAALAAALAALALSACGSDSGDDEWETHADKRGFELRHPEGWKVRSADDLLITVERPGGDELAAVAPFIAPAETTAEQCLERAPATFPGVLGDARLVRTRAGARDGEALASLRFERDGEAMRATMLCATDGRAGALYAIAAPAARFGKARERLVRILDSLRFTDPSKKSKDDDGSALPSFEKFTDPNERAFTVEVPEGWDVEGGLQRRSSVEVTARLEITSPDGAVRVFAGEDDRRAYALPNATLESTGFTEGSEYSPGYGVSFIVRSYATGAEYAAEHARDGIGCEGFEQTGGGDRPDLSERLGQIYEQNGAVAQRLEVGDVEFSCSNEPEAGYVLGGTLLTEFEGIGNWSAEYLYGYRAKPDAESLARAVMDKLVSSFTIESEWAASQQQLTANVSQIVSETNAEISEIISSGYEERQQVLDDIYRDWSNYTLGQTDVRDPATGEEFKVASGHNYYWRRTGSGEVVGEDVGDRPDIDFELLEEF